MFDMNWPHITDDGMKAFGNIGFGFAAVLDTPAATTAVWGALLLGGCWLAFKVWEELRNGTVKHDVLHRGLLAPTS